MNEEAKMTDNGGVIEEQVSEHTEVTDADMDNFLDEKMSEEIQTPVESSPTKEVETPEPEKEATATAEVDKTEKVAEIEEDGSLSTEEKMAQIQEILGDDLEAIDAYVKSKGYHNDPAWKAQRALIQSFKDKENDSRISEEDKAILESPEYITAKLQREGVTDQNVINYELKKAGYEVQEPPSPNRDIELAAEALGVDPTSIPEENRAVIEDVAKVARAIINAEMPTRLAPINEILGKTEQQRGADKLVSSMQEQVKSEGILDYQKDIVPAINDFMDKNPQATQKDVLEHFKDINHIMALERKGVINRTSERAEAKGNNRPLNPSVSPSKVPAKTGDDDKDADAFLNAIGTID